jgi:trehalose/maltose hydrolase-like predicted phosphorylase
MSERETEHWSLVYHDWQPSQQPLREALCTLGNGHFATRGAAEEAKANGVHYPGTYLAGGYNRLQTEIAGRVIENEDLVNWPNWLWLNFRIGKGRWFDLASVEILQFRQELNVRLGVLERYVRFRDADSRESTLCSRRIVHMRHPSLAAIQWNLTPHNWSGEIRVRAGLDGSVTNRGVERYRDLSDEHLLVVDTGRIAEDGIYLLAETNQSHIRMAQAARTHVFADGQHAAADRRTGHQPGAIFQDLVLTCHRSQELRVEKTVALFTSRDPAISEPAEAAQRIIRRPGSFDELLQSHQEAWSQLWHRCDIQLEGVPRAQFVLRLHIFHLLQTVSRNTVDRDVGVPARGLHGEAYRGHIFWDELFIFPFLNASLPELTRELLMYRYRRLDEARHAAKEAGYRGAMFPWQSGSSGREESQQVHLNPRSGRWIPDNSYQQRHVNAAIAYNTWKYYEATGDMEFLSVFGAELIIDIARFWASIATYVAEHDRYEIHSVMGPDEFHTKYPDREELGLDNNAYTNVMAAWTIRSAQRVLNMLAPDTRHELLRQLQIGDQEIERWHEVASRMFVPFHGDGIISQFEGYERLDTFDWEAYREKYEDIQRLDRILEAENDTPNQYQAGKQADVLMLFYLFTAEELTELLGSLGYEFTSEMIPKNIEYYSHRTSHGSTLSRVVHSWVLSRSDRQRSWQLFEQALESDLLDIQGGTTSEGIHLGAMAGTVSVAQRCYAGIEMRDEVLWLNPCLPCVNSGLRRLAIRIHYRGHWLHVDLTRDRVKVVFEKGWSPTARVGFGGQIFELGPGESAEFELEQEVG